MQKIAIFGENSDSIVSSVGHNNGCFMHICSLNCKTKTEKNMFVVDMRYTEAKKELWNFVVLLVSF